MKFYLIVAGVYFLFLLFGKFSDRECSRTNVTSWLIVVSVSALWILVIPISLIEINVKALAKARLEETKESINSVVGDRQTELVEVEADSNNIRLTPENT